MKKYLRKTLLISSLFISSFCLSQELKPDLKFTTRNNVNIEALGNGRLYSLNYERLLINRNRTKSFIRGGFGITNALYFPIMYNHLFSRNNNHIELGIGITAGWSIITRYGMSEYFRFLGNFNIGYRFQKSDGKFLFKAFLAPSVDLPNYSSIEISIGLSIGYCF
jgi:hypothetical protein